MGCAIGIEIGNATLCHNWRRFSVAMLTSARQTKQNNIVSLLNTSAHNLLYGGALKLDTLLCGDVNFRSTNEVKVLIVIVF